MLLELFCCDDDVISLIACTRMVLLIFPTLFPPDSDVNSPTFQSLFKKRSLRVTICGKTSKRIKQIARGEDVSKNQNFNNRTPAKRSAPNNTGSASVKRKREDDTDNKRQRPAFMSRKSDEEVEVNAKNANKRINLKVLFSALTLHMLCIVYDGHNFSHS